MGIIDETTYKLRCSKCSNIESLTILDKGSTFGGSSWESGKAFACFETDLAGGGAHPPKLTKATCKTCGTAAVIECLG